MEIKKLGMDDLGAVIALYKDMLENIDNQNFFKETGDNAWEDYLKNGVLWGYFEDSKLIAISGLELDELPYEISEEFAHRSIKVGELMCFIVHSKFRGQGIINKINLKLIETAKSLGYEAVCAAIHPANMSCIKAFAKLGKPEFIAFDLKRPKYPYVVYGVKI